MSDRTVVIAGIPIPSDDPIFLGVVGLHVLIAFVCVIAGIGAMLSRKGHGRHPEFGTVYFWSLALVFVTATILSIMRWRENYHLFILGVLAFAAAAIGRTALRQRWPHWVRLHLVAMGSSYILLLTAFYVDNGKNLPLWKELPSHTGWCLPRSVFR